jgi:serine/threonine protein kinase
MPPPRTTDDFLALVRKSAVVEPDAVDAYVRRPDFDPSRPPKKQATAMVRAGLLTALQAGLLLKGKWRNFQICGKYKLLEHLGTGGMGQVFLCEHARMRRRVAIKVLPPEKAADPVSLQRFYREARAVAALDHPNIVRAHDVDCDGGLHFLVMEYVDGSSLRDIVLSHGPLPVTRACHYVFQAADGLQHAHEAGLVHRDVKPSNLLVDRGGTVRILDLGLVRFFRDGDNLTGQHAGRNLLGTADYLAPEQALDSHRADVRSDIFSLGVTFFFLLTGRTPFRDGTIAEKLKYHQEHAPLPVRSLRPEVPAGLARVIDRMIAKDPAERYQTPADVMAALDEWTRVPVDPPPECEMPSLSLAARGSSSANLARATVPAEPNTPWPATRRAGARAKQLAVAAALVLCGVGTGLALNRFFAQAHGAPNGLGSITAPAGTEQGVGSVKR